VTALFREGQGGHVPEGRKVEDPGEWRMANVGYISYSVCRRSKVEGRRSKVEVEVEVEVEGERRNRGRLTKT